MPIKVVMDPGETRLFELGGGSTFTRSLNMTDVSNKVNVYYLQERPVLGLTPSNDRNNIIYNKEIMQIDQYEYIDYAHWLNKGSTISLSFKALKGTIDFYLFQGEDAFSDWLEIWEDGDTYSASESDIHRSGSLTFHSLISHLMSVSYQLQMIILTQLLSPPRYGPYRYSKDGWSTKMNITIPTDEYYFLVFVNNEVR